MAPEEVDLLRVAYEHATRSDDPNSQNGSLLVNDGLIIATACTRLPKGVHRKPERFQRPTKYKYIEHAERNAIFAAARAGKSTEGATLYCPWFACEECSRAIIEAGIKRIVGHKQVLERTHNQWKASCEVGYEMLAEAGVEIELYDGRIGGVTHLLNNEIWYP